MHGTLPGDAELTHKEARIWRFNTCVLVGEQGFIISNRRAMEPAHIASEHSLLIMRAVITAQKGVVVPVWDCRS